MSPRTKYWCTRNRHLRQAELTTSWRLLSMSYFLSLRRNIESTQAIVALLDRAMAVYSQHGPWSIVPNYFKDISWLAPPYSGDDYLFFKQEEELWQKSQTLNVKVYVSAGEKELEPFLQSVIRFRERFIAHNYKGFEFTFHILRERDHEDQYMEALLNGLEYLYGIDHPTG